MPVWNWYALYWVLLIIMHSTKKPVTTMLTYPWKCTVLHCNHLGNTWKPLVLMTRHFDYCPSASEGDNQSVGSSAPVVSRCFPGGYNVKLYISRGRLAWWLLAFLHSDVRRQSNKKPAIYHGPKYRTANLVCQGTNKRPLIMSMHKKRAKQLFLYWFIVLQEMNLTFLRDYMRSYESK